MTTRLKTETLLARDEIVAAPNVRACEDQSFELPPQIHVAMAILFAGFIAVLGSAFSAAMGVPLGVIFFFLGAFFGIPALFPRMAPERTKTLSWFEFSRRGIATATGRARAGEATILVLLLPVLVLCFAVAVATVAALV